jgi:hypothetical protein
MNNVSVGLSTYYYSQYNNKKYSAYYMDESYSLDEDAEESIETADFDQDPEGSEDSKNSETLES